MAIAIPTNSQVDENGGIVKRLNLIRPAGNQKLDEQKLARSHWREIPEREFVRLWGEKVNEAPPFMTETLYLITGLLLPIWNRLDSRQMKVYRLQTECGQRLLGRVANWKMRVFVPANEQGIGVIEKICG
jgi:hypothetical protein